MDVVLLATDLESSKDLAGKLGLEIITRARGDQLQVRGSSTWSHKEHRGHR